MSENKTDKTDEAETDGAETKAKKQAQVFDRSFKRVMSLSQPAIVQLINGLFNTDYPLDTKVVQLSTEYVTKGLEKFIADIRLLVDKDKYLVEAQMTDDDDMAIRIFNYEYLESVKNMVKSKDIPKLDFSRCIVIYLEPSKKTPKNLELDFVFPDKSIHRFTVPTLRFTDLSIADIEERNLSLLLPFYLLKLRKRVQSAKTSKQRKKLAEELIKLVKETNEAVKRSEKAGRMSKSDMRDVLEMVLKLYNNIYEEYEKYPEFEEAKMLADDMFLTYSEEAEIRRSLEIAQELIKKGWTSIKEIAETTKLDVETVESWYEEQFPNSAIMNTRVMLSDAEERALEIAQNLKDEGWSIEKIAKTTKLNIKLIEALFGENIKQYIPIQRDAERI